MGNRTFQSKYKMNADAFNDWSSQDHVREWTLDLTDIVEGNMAPNSVNRPRKRTRDWVPVTALEKDFATKIGSNWIECAYEVDGKSRSEFGEFGDGLE